jgi:hypothetical protein
MDSFEERVRQRAYRMWVEEGCPEGRSDVHWDKARELVAIEDGQKLTTKPAPRGEQGGEPVEPIEAVENAGEFPTLTDQGEKQAAPKRRTAAPVKRPTKAAPTARAKPTRAGKSR